MSDTTEDEERGTRAQLALNHWLRENWLLLTVFAIVISWGVRMEGKTNDRYTGTQAATDKAEIVRMIYHDVGSMRTDIASIKADVAYIKGKHDQEKLTMKRGSNE